MDMQKFVVEIDGVEKEANMIRILNIANREYAIYSVDNGNDTSDVLYSEIVKDSDGFDKLVDVQNEEVRKSILEIVSTMFSN